MKLIACVDNQFGIGLHNQLPWYLPEDLKHFKETTLNKTVIMGYKTYESLPEKNKPLPDRLNVVLTRDKTKHTQSSNLIITDHKTFMRNSSEEFIKECFVIGGSEIYELFNIYINEYFLTVILKDFNCDKKLNIDLFTQNRKVQVSEVMESITGLKYLNIEIKNS